MLTPRQSKKLGLQSEDTISQHYSNSTSLGEASCTYNRRSELRSSDGFLKPFSSRQTQETLPLFYCGDEVVIKREGGLVWRFFYVNGTWVSQSQNSRSVIRSTVLQLKVNRDYIGNVEIPKVKILAKPSLRRYSSPTKRRIPEKQ